jgi:23S rRNA pseudouridine1911/1915/1917 synthase
VHRLDKDTTGVLIFAKTENFHQHLANQIQERTVEKWYEAFVVGNPQDGEIQGNIGRSSVNKTKQSIMSSGKESVTRFYNEQYFPRFNISKLRIHLLTGRMHQIRVHLSALGFPVLGDTVYGNEEWNQKFQLSSQCLHAKEYSFFNLQKKKITITAPLPEYFTLLLSSFV